jgi:hypothetical protein
VFDPLGSDRRTQQVERYRNWLDPVSILDRSATRSVKLNPFDSGSMTHDYSNIADNFQSGGWKTANGWKNADGSVSITQ